MPDRRDHALPLRIERGPSELRIASQAIVAVLAKKLGVDISPDGASFVAALDAVAGLIVLAMVGLALYLRPIGTA